MNPVQRGKDLGIEGLRIAELRNCEFFDLVKLVDTEFKVIDFEIIPIARKKLRRRGIPEEWIRETLNLPGQTVDGYGGRKVAHKKYRIEHEEYLLRVIYEEKEELKKVVTAYLTSQIERYWKEEEDEN